MTAAAGDSLDPRPVAPSEPEPWECCQSGCDPCVYDRYCEALTRYEQALTDWERRQAEKNSATAALPEKQS